MLKFFYPLVLSSILLNLKNHSLIHSDDKRHTTGCLDTRHQRLSSSFPATINATHKLERYALFMLCQPKFVRLTCRNIVGRRLCRHKSSTRYGPHIRNHGKNLWYRDSARVILGHAYICPHDLQSGNSVRRKSSNWPSFRARSFA